jgi:hypothetical protein
VKVRTGDRMKRLLIVLTVLVAVIGFCVPADAAIPAAERTALIDLYTSTSGSNWTNKTNWNGTAGTECTWLWSDAQRIWGQILKYRKLSFQDLTLNVSFQHPEPRR